MSVEAAVLGHLTRRGPMGRCTVTEITRATRESKELIRDALKRMVAEGRVMRTDGFVPQGNAAYFYTLVAQSR